MRFSAVAAAFFSQLAWSTISSSCWRRAAASQPLGVAQPRSSSGVVGSLLRSCPFCLVGDNDVHDVGTGGSGMHQVTATFQEIRRGGPLQAIGRVITGVLTPL